MPSSFSQLPLDLAQQPSFDLSDFIVSGSNADAYRFVGETWPSHFCAIVGPNSSGKSHLVQGWAQTVGGRSLAPDVDVAMLMPGQVYYIDDVNHMNDAGEPLYSDELLFHIFNWTKEIDAKVLVTADEEPSRWGRELPDLNSRLALLPVVRLGPPDDELLRYVFLKLFSDRQLDVNIKVIDYILPRMVRSLKYVTELVKLVDTAALAQKKPVSIKLVKEVMGLS